MLRYIILFTDRSCNKRFTEELRNRGESRAGLWGALIVFLCEKFLYTIVCYRKYCRLGSHAPWASWIRPLRNDILLKTTCLLSNFCNNFRKPISATASSINSILRHRVVIEILPLEMGRCSAIIRTKYGMSIAYN